ncbi:aspartate/glutamate racemase family protein [Nocardioides sp. ChNu-153]|uniref:aspartate/glutamate racemase family protein n=1 Tax=unclassified Nocardioides TaxID=2615069 RepID=UPI002406222A|nr:MULTISPECIES: aspartate/glutamate racemase family protein [unclassified Nocardioides]MDF9715674.1 aspartate/glutamate racemase family protein [Nocardioides sp. ChNu-99]MDN7121657.1 aspartate/glutamate racemase family protein [Nocardioides sp. ChNu-153]
METIGLIGGMSWHSTATYYRTVNEAVAAARGGHASARIALQSLDFAEVRALQEAGDWDGAAALLVEASRRCVAAGATTVAICTNLMHKVAPQVEAALDVPLLHIGDAVAAESARHRWGTLGVLGTRWVMEEPFYAERLAGHGIATVVPDAADRALVDAVIFDELTQGVVDPASRERYVEVIARLAERGADAVVLACTEIGLLVGPDDSPVPLIDSADVHARELGRVAAGTVTAEA